MHINRKTGEQIKVDWIFDPAKITVLGVLDSGVILWKAHNGLICEWEQFNILKSSSINRTE